MRYCIDNINIIVINIKFTKKHETIQPSEKTQLTQKQKPNKESILKTPNLGKPKTQELQQEQPGPTKEQESQEIKQIQNQMKNPKQPTLDKQPLPLYIQTVNDKKYHNFIVPDSEFVKDGTLKNSETHVYMENLQPTLMHKMIYKIQPQYSGWVACFPSFNGQDLAGNFVYSVMTGIKTPPWDLVGVYFESPF